MEINIDAPLPPQPGDTPGGKFLEALPEAYRQKDWAQKLSQHENPQEEFYKQFDNQVSLIGRKTEGIKLPGEGATEDDWKNFHKSIGVPDTVDGYAYKLPELPAHLKEHFAEDAGLVKVMKEAALSAGVRPDSFGKMTEAFDKYVIAQAEAQIKGMSETLNKVESEFKAKFGERSKQVLDSFQASVMELNGTADADIMDALDPRVKAVIAAHHENFAKKYIREDKLDLNTPSSGGTVMTANEYSEEYGKLFARVRGAQPGSADWLDASAKLKALKDKGASTTFAK